MDPIIPIDSDPTQANQAEETIDAGDVRVFNDRLRLVDSGTVVFLREHGIRIEVASLVVIFRFAPFDGLPPSWRETVDGENNTRYYDFTGDIQLYPANFRTFDYLDLGGNDQEHLYFGFTLSRLLPQTEHIELTYSIVANQPPETPKGDNKLQELIEQWQENLDRLSAWVEPLMTTLSERFGEGNFEVEVDEEGLSEPDDEDQQPDVPVWLMLDRSRVERISESLEMNPDFLDEEDKGLFGIQYWVPPEWSFKDLVTTMKRDLSLVWFRKES